ncbi:hypothetical protein ANO14919_074430 [Xylariales sp. No.14919]|nr:hypothetical protein ANO14919_074430 [Xylariales sp. No.14919]
MVAGLATRKQETRRDVYFIHAVDSDSIHGSWSTQSSICRGGNGWIAALGKYSRNRFGKSVRVVGKILDGEPIPSGERGIYFTVPGKHRWKDIASGIASVGHALGVLPSADIKFASLEDAAAKWIGGISVFTETVFASNARTKSDLAEELGWVHKSDDSALKIAIEADVKLTAGS